MNKYERVKAVLDGKTPDRLPAAFWYHFQGLHTPAQYIQAHVAFYDAMDMDMMKIMNEYMVKVDFPITEARDFLRIRPQDIPRDDLDQQLDVIKGILDARGGQCMTFATVFSGFKALMCMVGDERLMAYYRQEHDALMTGVRVMHEAVMGRAQASLQEGVDGLYLSAQHSEPGRMCAEDFARDIRPDDVELLELAQAAGKYSLVHICGEPRFDFVSTPERYVGYPGSMFNWAAHATGVTLAQGSALFKRPVLGGVFNRGVICEGTPQQAAQEVREIVRSFGTEGLMIGADCTLQGTIRNENIRAAVDAAHEFCCGG